MTHQTPIANVKLPRPADARGLRQVVIVSTALTFAAVFGWLACIQRLDSGEIEFHWQASAWLWIVIGIASTIYFWRQIWPAQNVSPTGAGKRVFKGWAVLMIPSLLWMAYPLRFISGQQLLNVFTGLIIAASVLTFGGWMVFRLIKGFADETASPVKTDSIRQRVTKNAPMKSNTPPPTV